MMFTLSEVFKPKTPYFLWLHCCIKWKYYTGLVDYLASQEHLGPPLEFKIKLYEFEQWCAALHEYMLTGPC